MADEAADRSSMANRANFNTVAAVIFIALSVMLYLIIPSQIEKPIIVLAEDAMNLKATVFPQLVAAGFFVLGIWYFVHSFRLTETQLFGELDRDALINVGTTLAAMTIYAVVMVVLGFVVSGALMIAFLATFYGNRNYALTAIVSLAVPVAIYFTFTKLLATSLPPFPIDTFLTRYSIL